MYYPPPRGGSNSTGVIILLVIVVMCCMFVMPALGFGAWTLFKKDDKEESSDDKEETSGPQLTFDQDATKTINENENTEPSDDTDETTQVGNSTTSTYKIEYAGGGDGSNAIDLTLSWTNGTGFDEVAKLEFVRSVSGKELQTESTTDETATSNDGKGSITFKGTNIADDVDSALGENVVQAFAYDSEGGRISGGNALATVTINLEQADLDQTYEGPFGDLTIPVTLSSDTMKLDKIIKKTYYSISHAPDIWFEIENNGDKVKFKRKKDMYLSIGGVDEFKLQNYKGRLVITNNDKIYVPGKGMAEKSKISTLDYWLAQCDLIGASLIVEDGNVRQNVEFVSPNEKFFAIYQNDGNFVVYMGSGSTDNKGILWSSGTDFKTEGQIVMRSQHNTQGKHSELSFSKKKDLVGGNIKKNMRSINEGIAPYKLLISDVGRLVVTDSNGQNMVMKSGGHNLQYFFQSTHGSVCGNDLSHISNGGGNAEEKQQVCAKGCYDEPRCIGYVMNDNTCFFKNGKFLNTGSNKSEACINAEKAREPKWGGKVRLNSTDKYDHTGFKYKTGRCIAVGDKPTNMPAAQYSQIAQQCPGKLSPEACTRSYLCAWNTKNSNTAWSAHFDVGFPRNEDGQIGELSNPTGKFNW